MRQWGNRQRANKGQSGYCLISPLPHGSLLSAGDLRGLDEDIVAANLLEQRHQAGVEKAELEEHEEGHGPVDLMRERVEHRAREIDAQPDLDERLNRHRLVVALVL